MPSTWEEFLTQVAELRTENATEISQIFDSNEIDLLQVEDFTFEILEKLGIEKVGIIMKILKAKEKVILPKKK
jgi:hypothetical protein